MWPEGVYVCMRAHTCCAVFYTKCFCCRKGGKESFLSTDKCPGVSAKPLHSDVVRPHQILHLVFVKQMLVGLIICWTSYLGECRGTQVWVGHCISHQGSSYPQQGHSLEFFTDEMQLSLGPSRSATDDKAGVVKGTFHS